MKLLSVLFACGSLAGAAHAVPAFSGAEGWGAITPGGRGGQVIHVTNLNDSGPGSFRAAVTASGPRTVVFDVAGRINLLSEVSITNPYLTIAGQTAPGQGITISGETVSLDTHDTIVRYMRFRRGTTAREDDSFGPDRTPGNIIIDHVSASWGYDENISIYRNKNAAGNVIPTHNVTIQWTISSEGLNEPSADHPFGHAFGSTLGGKGVNFHHNLWASNTGRNPSLSFSHFIDFRNNVIFNWQHRSMDGAGPEAHVNVINNYYKPGPATGKANNATQSPIPELKVRIVEPEIRGGVTLGGVGWWYVNGNVVEGYPEVTADNWEGESQVAPGVFARGVQFEQPFPVAWARVNTPHHDLSNPGPYPFAFPDPRDVQWDMIIPPLPTIATQDAQEAYDWVLAHVGASLVRDAVDERVIQSVIDGNPNWGPSGTGIINVPSDVGGYPVIPFEQRAANWDTDQDGMPDAWELAHGLNPTNPDDRNGDFDNDDFTNLEEYLNELGAFAAVKPIIWQGGAGRYARIENWDIAFQPSRLDTARIVNGQATVDAIAQHAGTLHVGETSGPSASLVVSSGGVLNIHKVLHVHRTGATQFSGGAIDLRNGAAVFDPPVEESDLLADLVEQIASGRNGGAWDGPGLRSALAASAPNTFGIGIARNSELANPWVMFAGEDVSIDSILLRVTFLGDTDLDGDVDVADLGSLASNWQSSASWIGGDFDYSGFVDVADLGLLASNWQAGVIGSSPTAGPRAFAEALASLGLPGVVVPEPGACAILVTGALLVLRRRRGA